MVLVELVGQGRHEQPVAPWVGWPVLGLLAWPLKACPGRWSGSEWWPSSSASSSVHPWLAGPLAAVLSSACWSRSPWCGLVARPGWSCRPPYVAARSVLLVIVLVLLPLEWPAAAGQWGRPGGGWQVEMACSSRSCPYRGCPGAAGPRSSNCWGGTGLVFAQVRGLMVCSVLLHKSDMYS